jgi:TolA-binding protein
VRDHVDVHPDHLLHEARLRPLSADEQRHLSAHLADCLTCRFVRDAGHAFDAEAAVGGAVPLDALVDRTMTALRAQNRRAPPSRPRRLAAGMLTGIAMLGGVAVAGYWGARHPMPTAAPIPLSPGAAPVPHGHRGEPAPAGAPAAAPAAPAPLASAVRNGPPRTPRPPGAARGLVLASRSESLDSAAALFAAANRARRQGQTAEAEAACRRLWTRFHGSQEALTSHAIFGTWMLDRGQPRAAVTLFSQYLAEAPDGDLEEDVLVGLAEALERAGDPAGAGATWQRLLVEHPKSVHLDRARAALARLRAGAPP